MKAWLLLLLVGATAVSARWGFRKDKIYKYEVVGRSFASLHQVKNEWSGVVFKAIFEYETTKNGTRGTLTDLKYAEQQGSLEDQWENHLPDVTHHQFQPLPLSGQHFHIIFENGKITKLQVKEGVSKMELDLIRSVASQFQVISPPNARIIPSHMNALPRGQEPYGIYKVMEESVDGKCEVLYELSPVSHFAETTANTSNWVQYVKSKNFSNCDQLPVYHYGFPSSVSWKPGTNKMGEFLTRSELSKIVKAGLEDHIVSSETTSTIILSPEMYNKQKGAVISQLKLNLTGIENIIHLDLTLPKIKFTNDKYITYSLVNDYKDLMKASEYESKASSSSSSSSSNESRNSGKDSSSSESLSFEKWQASSPSLEEPPQPLATIEKGFRNAEDLLAKLSALDHKDLGSPDSLECFLMLVRSVRTLNYRQLRSLVQKNFVPNRDTTVSLNIRDAIAQAGTSPALLTMIDMIRQQKVNDEEAAHMIASLPDSARLPTPAYMRKFFELVKEEKIQASARLTSATAFAFSNLVRQAAVDKKSSQNRYPVYQYGPVPLLDINSVEEIYVPYFEEQLKQAVNEKNSIKIQLYIRVLGNIAYPTILRVFEPYLEGEKPLTVHQRTLLVVSLNKLAQVYPKLAQSVMYKIYDNELEPYQVRVAAVYGIMKTNPPVDLLERMATMANTEKSMQVRSAVKNSIQSVAALKEEWNSERRRNAAAVVHLLPAEVQGVQYSRQHLLDFLLGDELMGVEKEISWIGSQDSLIPQAVFVKGAEYYNDLYSTAYKFSGMVSSVEDLIDAVLNNGNHQSNLLNTKNSSDDIERTLKMAHTVKEDLEGNYLMKIAGIERFFSFDKKSLNSSIETLTRRIAELKNGAKFQNQNRAIQREAELVFPTALGFSFVYTYAQSTLMVFNGKVSIQTKTNVNGITKENILVINPDINIVYGSHTQGHLQFVAFNKTFMAGNDRATHVSIPLAGKITVDAPSNQIEVALSFKKTQDKQLYSYHSNPFTAILDAEPKLIRDQKKYKPLHVRAPRVFSRKITTPIFDGISFSINGRSEKDTVEIFNNIVPSLTYAMPFAEKTIEAVDTELRFQTQQSNSIAFTANYAKLTTDQYAEKQVSDEQSLQTQFFAQAAKNEADAHVVNLSLKIEGRQAAEFNSIILASSSRGSTSVLAVARSEPKQQHIILQVKANMPQVPQYNFIEAVKPQQNGLIELVLTHGNRGESYRCDAKVVLKRTEDRLAHVKQQPQALQCQSEMEKGNHNHYGCQNATFHAGLFDRYQVTINYKGMSDFIRERIARFFHMVSHLGYPYSVFNQQNHQTENDRIEAVVQYNPMLTKVNVSLTPSDYSYVNVPVHRVMRSLAVMHPGYSVVQRVGFAALRQQWEATCSIDESKMKTFDNCTHDFQPFKNQWMVLAGTAMERRDNYIILYRVDSTNRRQMRCILGGSQYRHEIELTPTSSNMEITLDDQKLNMKVGDSKQVKYNDETVIEITMLKIDQVKITTQNLHIMHEPQHSLLTLVSRGKGVAGLCGNVDMEPYDLITPQGNHVDVEEYFASWTLNPTGRALQLQEHAQQQVHRPQAQYHSNIVSEQDAGRANGGGQPVHKTHYYDPSSPESRSTSSIESNEVTHALRKRLLVIEHNGKHCFSTLPYPACKLGKNIVRSEPITVDFVCVTMNETSRHWEKLVLHGARPDFSRKGNAQTIQTQIPVECSK